MSAVEQDWWQDLTQAPFAWRVPELFNIASACVDYHDADDLALIVDSGGHCSMYTFGEIAALSRKFSTVLAESGLTEGDRVAVMVPQGVEVLTAHLGAFRAGMVTVPLSVKFGADAVTHRLKDSGARVLVVDADCFERIRAELTELPDLQTVLLVGGEPAAYESAKHLLGLNAVLDDANECSTTAVTTADSPAIIIYTSGTTGSPKGALHAHRVLPAHMPGVRTAFDNAPHPCDVFWTPADWAWIGGLFDVLFPALALGCPVLAMPDKFTPARALDVMCRHNVTVAFIPPTALKQMRSAGVDAASAVGVHLRALATGGEALGDALQSWVYETFAVSINEFYGQTEMNMVIGTSRSAWESPRGSMGRPFPGFTAALLDPTGSAVEAGTVGEICIAAGNPGQFTEYWNQPDKTREKVHDGWIHTGDLGSVDVQGNIYYEGRADDVISSAGYRIGPGEIEECLLSHDAVAMAGVVGVPDAARGEAIHAFVVLVDGTNASEDLRLELQRHVKIRLAFYQYPRHVTFIDQLPMTTTGKIMRRELRSRAMAARTS